MHNVIGLVVACLIGVPLVLIVMCTLLVIAFTIPGGFLIAVGLGFGIYYASARALRGE